MKSLQHHPCHQKAFRCEHRRRPLSRSPLLSPSRALTTDTIQKNVPEKSVTAEIEKTSWTSRKLYASIAIDAPVPVVWSCLTDYSGLANFIPSLVENECIQRKDNGAVLRQVGAQEVAMGVSFSAATTVDCTEYMQGVPLDMCSTSGDGSDGLFPWPKNSLQDVISQDITFNQVEGDFQAFRGIWRMQPSADSTDSTLLCYTLYVQPKPWLPVGLIQNRIENEVVRNLDAVRKYAEALHSDSQQ